MCERISRIRPGLLVSPLHQPAPPRPNEPGLSGCQLGPLLWRQLSLPLRTKDLHGLSATLNRHGS